MACRNTTRLNTTSQSTKCAATRRLDTNLLVALALSALAGVFLWHSWVLFPFKLLVVLMHESGHAAAPREVA